MRILSVTSSRADVGILSPVWSALCEQDGVDLHVFLTGMHMLGEAQVNDLLPDGCTIHRGGADLGGKSNLYAVESMGAIVRDCGAVCEQVAPDLMILVGDRLDMIPAALASLPFNIPIVHLHGGEVTAGAVDDRIRNAISKLSHVHCVSSPAARSRLLAMAEPAVTIHVTGAPGLDTLRTAPELTVDELAYRLELPSAEPFILATIHPETNSADPEAPLDAVLQALTQHARPTLFTAPNSDPGGADMKERILAFVEQHDWAWYRDTLGPKLYANALRGALLMIGNSSSGVIEAGMFGLPVIDVGDRQKGRERGNNVTTVASDAATVGRCLGAILSDPIRFPPGTPYGDGRSGPRIAAVLSELPGRQALLSKEGPGNASKPEREHA